MEMDFTRGRGGLVAELSGSRCASKHAASVGLDWACRKGSSTQDVRTATERAATWKLRITARCAVGFVASSLKTSPQRPDVDERSRRGHNLKEP